MSKHTDISIVAVSVAPSPATSGTSLGVTDANAAYLPDIYPWWALVKPTGAAPTRANSEIVKVTAGSSSSGTTTYTIVRAQGLPATTARTIIIGDDILEVHTAQKQIDTEEQSSTSMVRNEVPSGSINSSNTSYTLANTPLTGSLRVYLNGQRLTVTADYTISGTTLTMVIAPTTGDTLLVDYEINSGTYSTGSASWVSNETPSGTVNGSNATFTLVSTPITGTLALYRDGQLMVGGGADYTLTTNSIAFVTAPVTGSVLLAFYQSAASTAGNADTLDGVHLSTITDTALTGWYSISDSWTYASADAPTFTITVPSGAASKYTVGMRVRLTQTTVKYFIITVVADTVLTVYGGTDYTLANAAISLISVSNVKSPLGFPIDPTKWTVETTSTGADTQSSPTQNVWYNIASQTISIPIGVWRTMYEVWVQGVRATAGAVPYQTALSTANNSASDALFIGGGQTNDVVNVSQSVHKEKILTLSVKTSYYLNTRTTGTSITDLYNRGDITTTVIRAVCAYL